MKNSKMQITAVFLLMLAIFIATEGIIPQIFAKAEETLVMIKQKDGIEFKAVLDKNSFTENNELLLKSYYTNVGDEITTGVLGAAVVSVNNGSRFTYKHNSAETLPTDISALASELLPGKAIAQDFRLWPYYMENNVAKTVTPGKYIVKLWCSKPSGEQVEAVFPITITKRFGTMYISDKL